MRITTRSRLISLLLVLVMILSLFPVAVSAAEADGNLALSAMPSAISEHPSAKTAGINDGDTSTNSRWCPAESDPTKGLPAWCQLQWGNPVTFDKIVIYEWALALRTGEYNLSVSNDGSKFTEIYNGNTLDNGTKTIELDQPVTAKYLRLTITSIREDAKKHETPSISEIEVYDNSHNATISGVEVLETEAVIDQEKGTITFEVEPGIDLTQVMPVFSLASSGATISPTGPQNFNNPVTYTVTAKDGTTTKDYVVTAKIIEYLKDDDLSDNEEVEDVAAFGPVPTPAQYTYHRQELAAFLHFGMNTFTGSEWGSGDETPSQFTLTEKVDADTYVKTLKDAGFKKVIVTAKHHDGFCIWDSKWTDHDTASTDYPGGDVLADISAACTKYDLDMGLYLSPWDVNSEYYGYYDADGNSTTAEYDELDYNDYYDGQLIEILGSNKYGNNGKFVEIWMDGAKGSGSDAQAYDFERYVATMKEYEGDDLLLFGAGKYATVYWIGNENGVANEETWAKGNASYNGEGKITSLTVGGRETSYKDSLVCIGIKNGNKWNVPEADARITSGWFWGENKKAPKTLEALRDMYLDSVGHNAALLLNVPLNKQGKLDADIRNRVLEWGRNVQESFHEDNLAAAEGVTISASSVYENDIAFKPSNVADENDATYWAAAQGMKNGSLIIDFDKEVMFDAVTLEEEINHGQRVEAFSIYYKTAEGEWIEYFSGTTIGGKRVVLGRSVRATQVKINFRGMTDDGVVATPVISHVGVYKVTDAFEMGGAAPDGLTEIDCTASAFTTTDWEVVRDLNCTGTSYHQGTENDTMTVTFTGTKAWVIGLSSDAKLSVSVDGGTAETVTASDAVLFETSDLSDGDHTITLTVVSGTAKVDSVYVLNNGGKGLLDFEYDTYTVDEDQWFEVKVVRKGGSTGTISAIVQDNPGSAVQSSYVPTEGIVVNFADGEVEKTVKIRTKRYTETTGTLAFSLDLVAGDGETGLAKGLNTPAQVNIIDAESYPQGYLQKIEVTANPTKTQYSVNETLDTTGLEVTGTYMTKEETAKVVAAGSGLGQGKVVELETPIITQDLRLTITSVLPGQTETPGITEVEVYDSNGNNLALNADAYSNNTYGGKYSHTKINDSDNSGDDNRWSAAITKVGEGALPCWVGLRWDEPVEISKVVIYEWKVRARAGTWELSVMVPTEDRVMDADQYEITPTGPMTQPGEMIYMVTAKEDATKTDTFSVTVNKVDVTDVTLDTNEATLEVGKTKELTAIVEPSGATNKTVTWKSSDETVATVDQNGLVTAQKQGTATITVTTADGNKTAECVVTVVKPVTGVTVTKTATVNVKETVSLKAEVSPGDATNKAVTWTSSNPEIATVDNDGVVTGMAKGTVTITATTADGGFTDSCEVTVSDPAGDVEDMIDAIGRVTLGSKSKIEAAREAYEALTPTQKEDVENYDALVAAEAEYRKQVILTGMVIAGAAGEPVVEFPFVDVPETAWYYDEVKEAWENDLIDGMNETQYMPDNTLTVAQAIKLAAALHQMYFDGKVTLENGAPNWYDSYVDYAVANGIIEAKYDNYNLTQMNAAISREEFVHIFFGAMNMDAYYACNYVADNAIPDVKMNDTFASEIYTFYRAGILTGSDAQGTFKPDSNIKRSEVAAILIRMFDTNARQAVTLG